MKAMSTYIASGAATDAVSLANRELSDNIREVKTRKWTHGDILLCLQALNRESQILAATGSAWPNDSVKGEDAMRAVYAPYSGKAADIITLGAAGDMKIAELKYALKVGGSGPFRCARTFREIVSDKFLEMAAMLTPDGETIDMLRVIVVSEIQLPFAVARVRSIQGMRQPPGLYSSDGKQYDYVLCSSKSLQMMLHNRPQSRFVSLDCLFFKL